MMEISHRIQKCLSICLLSPYINFLWEQSIFHYFVYWSLFTILSISDILYCGGNIQTGNLVQNFNLLSASRETYLVGKKYMVA